MEENKIKGYHSMKKRKIQPMHQILSTIKAKFKLHTLPQ
mgnify:CR=1 FL=1|jgi:hypothetical protein